MFKFKILLAGASFYLMTLCGASASAQAESLNQAVEAALNYHPSVMAAQANRNALRDEADERFSDFFPQLSVSATAGRQFSDNSTSRGLNTTRGTGYSWLWEGNVSVRQMLFDGFETMNRVDAADMRYQSANYDIIDTRENLSLQTVTSYLDVLRTREAVGRLEAHKEKIEDYIKRITAMVDQGAADQTMIEQARDIKAQLSNSLANMRGQLRAAQAGYTELTGNMPGADMERPERPSGYIPDDIDNAIDEAQESHPMIRAATITQKAFGLDAEAEKAGYYPDVTGEVSYLKRDLDDVIGGEIRDGKAVVRMNWNYAVGGAQQARVRKAMHRRIESRAKMEEMQRRIAKDVEVAFSDHNVAAQQALVQKVRVEINEGLVRTQEAQFEAARANVLQIMQSDNALFNARLARMNAEYRVLASSFAILASMGRLQEILNVVPATAAHDGG